MAGLGASVVASEVVRTGVIDTALETGIDFRSIAFEVCLDKVSCRVGDLTIFAERKNEAGDWSPALIYWDPIDGFGVMGGRQNDEIDADERLSIDLGAVREVKGLWLSDLFIGEAERYQSNSNGSNDVETAQVDFFLGGLPVASESINGVFELPEKPFESAFTDIFDPGGDLLNRILVEDGSISIIMPDGDVGTPVVLKIGAIDTGKQKVFSQNAVGEVDIASLLDRAGNIPVFETGSANAMQIIAIRDDMTKLAKLQKLAEIQRRIGNAENGELGWYAGIINRSDRIVLTAGMQTSNDYSVAGLMIAGRFDNRVYMADLTK
jgi:hypothetical protein